MYGFLFENTAMNDILWMIRENLNIGLGISRQKAKTYFSSV